MNQNPTTNQQLDEIASRAAHLYEYVTVDVEGAQPDFDKLTGEDVPALLAEVRRLRAELATASSERDCLAMAVLFASQWTPQAPMSLREGIDEILATMPPAGGARAAATDDTLPAWLRQRFTATTVRWEDADDDDRSYWEHQARAVRRAVARGGFKAAAPASAVAVSGGEQ